MLLMKKSQKVVILAKNYSIRKNLPFFAGNRNLVVKKIGYLLSRILKEAAKTKHHQYPAILGSNPSI